MTEETSTRTRWTQSLHFWFNIEPLLPSEDGQNRTKQSSRKILTTGLSKYIKIKALSSLPFPGKIQLLSALFGLFLVGKQGGVTCSKVGIKIWHSYFTKTIPGQLNVKNVWFQHSPVLWLLVAKDISEKLWPNFSSLAAAHNTTP